MSRRIFRAFQPMAPSHCKQREIQAFNPGLAYYDEVRAASIRFKAEIHKRSQNATRMALILHRIRNRQAPMDEYDETATDIRGRRCILAICRRLDLRSAADTPAVKAPRSLQRPTARRRAAAPAAAIPPLQPGSRPAWQGSAWSASR